MNDKAERGLVLTPQRLIEELAARGERPAVVTVIGDEATSWSGAAIAEKARLLASGLIAAGVEPGEPVGLYGANRPEWVVARLALGAAGALAAPFDDLLPEAEIAPLIAHCGCRRVFTTAAHLAALRGLFEGDEPKWILLDAEAPGDSGATPEGVRAWQSQLAESAGPLPEVDPGAPAMIVTTSGTTGRPKSFTLSHANLSANVQAIRALGVIGESDRALLPLPLDNVYPTVVGLLCVLHSGSTLVFPEEITGPQIVKALKIGRATLLIGVPRLYAAVLGGIEGRVAARGRLAGLLFDRLLALSIALQRRWGLKLGRRLFGGLHRQVGPELRLLISGGAKLEPELIWRLEGLGWEVLSGYGLSEVGSVYTANLPWAKKIGSEGRPLHGPGSLRIVEQSDAEDEGHGPGEGEVQLKGPSMLAGYDDAEATAAAFTEDGWFRTGDLGRVDDEGYVWITGRLKEMIVLAGGKNVFPEPLEAVYRASPFIEEIAVLEVRGDLVGLIVPEPEAVRASGYSRVEDLFRVALADIGRPLPAFQRLSGFALTREPIPRTRLGKYRRFLLPALFEQARAAKAPAAEAPLSEADRALLQGWPGNELWALLQARYPDKPVRLDADPQLDLGIDSLEWVSLTLELERRFGLRLGEERIAEIRSLRDLVQAVAEAPSAPAEGAAESGPDPEGWLRPRGPGAALLGRSLHAASAGVMRLLFGVRSEGRENIPAGPPCLFVANHVSDLDPLVLAAALPPVQRDALHWGGDRVRLFEKATLRPLARALKVFPVDDRMPAASLALAGEALRLGGSLAWFPESWRSPDGGLQAFLPGVGRIVAGYDGPIVPVLIEGTFEAMPRSRRWPKRHPVTLHFGAPIEARALVQRCGGEEAIQEIANALKEALAALRASGVK